MCEKPLRSDRAGDLRLAQTCCGIGERHGVHGVRSEPSSLALRSRASRCGGTHRPAGQVGHPVGRIALRRTKLTIPRSMTAPTTAEQTRTLKWRWLINVTRRADSRTLVSLHGLGSAAVPAQVLAPRAEPKTTRSPSMPRRASVCAPAHRDRRRGYLTCLSGDYPAAASAEPPNQ